MKYKNGLTQSIRLRGSIGLDGESVAEQPEPRIGRITHDRKTNNSILNMHGKHARIQDRMLPFKIKSESGKVARASPSGVNNFDARFTSASFTGRGEGATYEFDSGVPSCSISGRSHSCCPSLLEVLETTGEQPVVPWPK